jgi:23S rRNA pseudouridine2605 synthase
LRRPKREEGAESPGDGLERLQKVMADAGIASRRDCEELIQAGRVEVDGRVVTQLGTKVDPTRQSILVDGTKLPKVGRVYYVIHKPPGVVSTNDDPSGRMRVVDLLPAIPQRVYTVGRLDRSSEGLIVVTNDGQFALRLTHPRFGVEKTYEVQVAGLPTLEILEKVRRGIHLAEGPARVVRMRIKSKHKQSTILEMILAEGQNREIRRIMARVGHKVMRLRRVAIGPLRLQTLAPGAWRKLTTSEVRMLLDAAGGPKPSETPA